MMGTSRTPRRAERAAGEAAEEVADGARRRPARPFWDQTGSRSSASESPSAAGMSVAKVSLTWVPLCRPGRPKGSKNKNPRKSIPLGPPPQVDDGDNLYGDMALPIPPQPAEDEALPMTLDSTAEAEGGDGAAP